MVDAAGEVFDARSVLRARFAVSCGFFVFGFGFAVWAVHIPVVAARLGLDPAILGLALLNVGLGGVISQPITGWGIARTGSRQAATVLLPLFLSVFIVPIVAWSTPVFFVGTIILGVTFGSANVALNTQASEIEIARRRPTMSSFHGFASLGGLAGASIGGGIIAVGWQDGSGAAIVATILLAVAGVAAQYFLPTRPTRRSASQEGRGRLALSAPVLALAVLAFFANSVEGGVNDWSALYLATVRGLSTATAASGFAVFSFGMAICRLAGGRAVVRLGERRVVLFGGALVAVGMAVVVLSPWAVVSPFGYALVAIGEANAIPVMMGPAARAPGVAPSAGVAATATGALLAFLVGPPVIGFIAHATNLSLALGVLSLSGVVVMVGAALYRWPGQAGRSAA